MATPEKLKLFYQVTENFSGTKYPTSNIFFPLICDMKLSLLSWSVYDNSNVIHNVMSVAIVLDPRYKLKLINYFFPKLYGEEARSEIMQVRNIITELFEEYKRNMMKNKALLGNDNVQQTSLREGFLL
uniref:hAT-like transposase RNase-H fold domain-containing protein n=1 Tax=Lactuca sativa TaxID=4236 RepID=A0A9R1WHG6_LACSA|nr:hypothetical protein LSAT_V11C200077990 [Lactuca sativa]